MIRLARQIPPILAALKRHRLAVVLLVLQIAATLAILCNALSIAQQRIAHLSRPTGIDEQDLAIINVQWIGKRTAPVADAAVRDDLQHLRELPGVADAYADYTYPAAGPMAQLLRVRLTPTQAQPTSLAEAYNTDEHAIGTLGLELIAGRNFRTDEITPRASDDASSPPAAVIITRDLAAILFPNGPAPGHAIYLGDKPSTIVGVVNRLQVPALNTNRFAYRSILLPYRPVDPAGTIYLVRARPGRLAAVLHAAPPALLNLDRLRVVRANSYRGLRAAAYSQDRGVATMMAMICAILLAAAAAGIGGLSGYWVEQRHRQIGIRRAVGATRHDILHGVQIENGLLVVAGVAIGAPLAWALAAVLMRHYELQQLSIGWVICAAAGLFCLGQLAVLGPALRAARVPPAVATRSS